MPETRTATDVVASPWNYWVDAMQRSVLFMDALRERGNVTLEHERAGKPPVLAFDHDMVVDGRDFDSPVAYALLRLKPLKRHPVDPRKRAFVVIDPRAGHGPGIGGFKIDSEVGIALRSGHPCYFISFFPQPCPGQTIESVARAEAAFLRKVNELHPDTEGKPFVIGNCQGGWALAMLASAAPELVGPVLLAGSPLSYWAGVEGRYPMRYSGGLLGGTWLSSLSGDLGNGIFDGAHLVSNFEQLDPANSLWSKWYDLYANIDTERERFLDFERWWTGNYLLAKAEMDWITQNLFVGNRLTAGEVRSSDGETVIDLRRIRSPIIVFASWGDNITPPQQALNWIPDLYADVDEIRALDQVIVYCLHEKSGHLGIFVSGAVASREHAELIGGLDLIDTLPPGLYEAHIEDTQPDLPRLDLVEGRYLMRIEPRSVDDILALDDGRDDERAFEVVRRAAELNQSVYDRYLSPVVKAMSNPLTASWLRMLHPVRFGRYAWSDLNPAMAGVKALAEGVRKRRQPAAADHPWKQAEHEIAKRIDGQLDDFRDRRDALYEHLFNAIYASPWVEAAYGVTGQTDARLVPRGSDALNDGFNQSKLAATQAQFESGDTLDAWVRIMLYQGRSKQATDERPFNLMRKLAQAQPPAERPTPAHLKDALKRQTALMRLDEKRAIAALPNLLPKTAQRREAIAKAREVAAAQGDLSAAQQTNFRHLERVLGLRAAVDRSRSAPAEAEH